MGNSCTLKRIFATVMFIVAMTFGQSAWGTTKTVTYRITNISLSSGASGYNIVFTRTSGTPFETSAPTTYTAYVSMSSIAQTTGGSGSFSVQLADGFQLNASWSSGSDIRFMSNCIYPNASDKYITYSVSCNNTNYYVTHVMMTGYNSGYEHGLLQVFPHLNEPIDYDYNNVVGFNVSYGSRYAFGQITVTYADAPTLDIFESDGENAYKIKSKDDLRHLANYVNKGHNSGSGVTFRQTQNITCDNSYTPIGTSSYPFGGTYDGQEYTVSSITVSRSASNIGFFGYIDGGTVKDLLVISSTFTGIDNVGAIAGTNHNGTIQNCVVGDGTDDVKIRYVTNSTSNHGGIVGSNSGANAMILGCKSRSKVIGTDCSSASNYGGIAGSNEGTIQDCLYTGIQVNGNNYNGTLVGHNSGTLTNNYYTSNSMPGGLGINGQTNGNDGDGARRARIVTTGADVVLDGAETATYGLSGITVIGTGSYAMRFNGTLYSGATQNITFSYTGLPALGYVFGGFSATNGGTFSGNILTMPANTVNVTATFTDVWGVTNTPAAYGTEAHPYIISDTTGLNLLARNVNGTSGYTANNFSGKYFKLNNDITYSTVGINYNESNYTAIGRSQTLPFCGVFDGDGNTIYNIRINTTDDNQGLFGWIDSNPNTPGAVKNVRVKNAHITGGQHVGEIVGYLSGDIENCLALSSSINGTSRVGAIAGYKATSGHTCFGNYYVGCTVSGTSGATNVGVGSEPGYGNDTPHDLAGVRSVHLIILNMQPDEEFGASGSETVEIEGATYYASTSTITLTYNSEIPEGYELRYYYYDGVEDHLVTAVNDVYSFTMPAANVTVLSNFAPIVYTITYDLAGGSLPSGQSNRTTYNVTQSTFTLVNPVRIGYEFAGWTGTGLSEPTQTVTIAYHSTGDREYTATWTDLWGIEDDADGSEDHPYIISNITGLDMLAKIVNGTDGYNVNSFNNNHFKLGADIDYSTKPLDANGENFTTIGCYHNMSYLDFRGTFDGDGHTISGIRINKTDDQNESIFIGLFRRVGGTVENLTLSDARITGFIYVGGIAGNINTNAKIMNCHVTSSVVLHAVQDNANCFGGIAGASSSNSIIDGCSSSATLSIGQGVSGCQYFGGIAGHNEGRLQNCVVLGATIPDLHYTGQNNSFDASGAVAGFNNWAAHIHFNYYSGVTIGGATTGIGVSGNDERHDITADNGAVPVCKLSLGEHIFATPAAAITHNNSGYYVVGTTVTLNAEGYTMSGGFSVKDAQNNDVPLSGGNTFVMPESDVTITANLTVIDWEGSGDVDDPYMITYPSQLDLLAERVNGGNEYHETYFKLGADIEYPHMTAWNDVTSTENNFTVIGDRYHVTAGLWSTHTFRGVFDGDGHTISGIRIFKNTGELTDGDQGLFGCVYNGGIVKNLTLSDARITAGSSAGGITGVIYRGTVENCHVTGTVAIHAVDNCDAHGGIVGYNNKGTVRGCTSAATLSKAAGLMGCDDYGGIVGLNHGFEGIATVENCLAVGVTVDANYDAGAIFGFSETDNNYHGYNNYYYGCKANGNSSNIGSGVGDINSGYNINVAAPCYKLSLPTGLTARDDVDNELICYQGNLYVTVGQMIFPYPVYGGYTISGATYNDGQEHTITPDAMGYYAFAVTSAHDITVTVTWGDLPTWSGHGEENDPYIISNRAELDALAIMVNSGNMYENQYFKLANDINYPHATAWNDVNSTENNFTTIAAGNAEFRGIFDGDGHTISGIRIYKEGSGNNGNFLGLFGYVNQGSVINLTLSDARITGYEYVGGIAGTASEPDYGNGQSFIVNCHVSSSVAIHAVADNARYHGGIVGYANASECSHCTSSASLTVADGVTECQYFGGIAGYSYQNTDDCLAVDVTMSAGIQNSGAIVGGWHGSLRRNFYHNCHRGDNFSNIGTGNGDQNTNNTYGAYPANAVSVSLPGYGDGNGKWAFIASPMNYTMTPHHVQNLMNTTATHYDLYRFDQGIAGAEWQNYKAHAGIDSNDDIEFRIENGLGYLYANKEDVTLTFLGKPNVETESEIDLSYTEGKPLAGYNLVGNPFTVAAYADRPYYKMNAAGTDVEAVESYWANSIPACTGVVVVANGADEHVTFSTTAPEAPAASTGNNGSLQMTLTKANERGDAFQDKAVVSFNEGMQLSKFIFNDDHAKLYLPKNDKNYAIISSDKQEEILVYFKAKESGIFSISFEGTDLNNVKLIDKIEDLTVDLSADGSYTFIGVPSDRRDRFVIRFESSAGQETLEVFAYQNGNDLIVNGEGELQVFDVMGRMVMEQHINGVQAMCTSSLQTGVYILKLNGMTQKIVIR